MYDFILQIVTFLSLGVLIYLFARALPRINENVSSEPTPRTDYIDKAMKKLPLSKIDSMINLFIGKALRRIKVVVMKVDNVINRHLNKVKKNGDSGDKAGFPDQIENKE